MAEYTVIYEKGPTSRGAYVPDFPGVIAVGDSRDEVERLIREASNFILGECAKKAFRSHRRPALREWWRTIPPCDPLEGENFVGWMFRTQATFSDLGKAFSGRIKKRWLSACS